MFSVNSIELQNLGEFEYLKSQDETRTSHYLNGVLLEHLEEKFNFASDAHRFPYARDIEIPYLIDGQKQFLPLKGTRPNFRKRYELGNSGFEPMHRFLIKHSNKEVWLSETDNEYTASPSGVRIASAEEDLKIVFCEFQAGGGAGNGSNLVTHGRGGAAGAYIIIALDLEHSEGKFWKRNSFPITIGGGGLTCDGNNEAGNGGDTGLPWNNGEVTATAYGGNGAIEKQGGICRGYGVSNCEIAKLLYAAMGNSPSESTQIYSSTVTSECAPNGEANKLVYPQRTAVYNGSGEAGGCSVLGNGGQGTDSGKGGDAGHDQWGAGGGGGGYKAFNIFSGGNGCGGYLAIYY